MTVLSSPNGTRFMRRRISLIGIGCNYLYWSRTCETAASSSSLRRTRESSGHRFGGWIDEPDIPPHAGIQNRAAHHW